MSEQEIPDPQVPEKARRRRFTAKYKLEILKKADKCTEQGDLGSLLRREGLYHSQLSQWRKQRETSALSELSKKRGRKPRQDPSAPRVTELERECGRLRHKLKQAEAIIDAQKKLSQVLGITLDQEERS
jgi:transposase